MLLVSTLMSPVGHTQSEREVGIHSWTAPANGPPHSNVITRRNVTAKDPRPPVAPAEPRHSQFVPEAGDAWVRVQIAKYTERPAHFLHCQPHLSL
jgi:hypothetical protein